MDLCRRAIGLGLVEAMALLLPDADAETHALFAERYKAHFLRARTEGRVHEPLFPGILDLLDALEESGWLLAVATGKSDRGLRLCLESHGIHARFASLQTGDRHPSKPSPSMALQAIADAGAAAATTIVVGDTSYDMGMATAAGAIGIGAGWGYHAPDELIAAGAVGVARTPPEVLELITEQVDG
jgi:phosphoglycolate phosphatase